MQIVEMKRRSVLIATAAFVGTWPRSSYAAGRLPRISVTRDPGCGCCGGWMEHLRSAGFDVKAAQTTDLDRTKVRLGVPPELWACHTAEVAGYGIEGHVPAAAIGRLLAERPPARGLAVPGMPIGSPGMEVAGEEPEAYDVILFGSGPPSRFARYRGSEAI